MWLDDLLPRDEASEGVRTRESAGHQRVEIHAVGLPAFARIDQQLAVIVLGRFDIDAESRRRRDNRVVERMRRLTVGIQIGIHIEELAERYLAAHSLQIHSRSVLRADLQVRLVEMTVIAVSIPSDEVGQLPLSGC